MLQTRLVERRVAGVEHRELRDRLGVLYDGGRGVGRREGVGERSACAWDVAVSGRNLVGPSSGPTSCRATKHVASTRSSVHSVSLWQGCGGDPRRRDYGRTLAEHRIRPAELGEGGADGAVRSSWTTAATGASAGIHEDVPPAFAARWVSSCRWGRGCRPRAVNRRARAGRGPAELAPCPRRRRAAAGLRPPFRSADGSDELIRRVRLQSVDLAAELERLLLRPRRLRRPARLAAREDLLERAPLELHVFGCSYRKGVLQRGVLSFCLW